MREYDSSYATVRQGTKLICLEFATIGFYYQFLRQVSTESGNRRRFILQPDKSSINVLNTGRYCGQRG